MAIAAATAAFVLFDNLSKRSFVAFNESSKLEPSVFNFLLSSISAAFKASTASPILCTVRSLSSPVQ